MAINLVIIREDNNTVWHHSLDDDFFPCVLEYLFRFWLEKIRDEEEIEKMIENEKQKRVGML